MAPRSLARRCTRRQHRCDYCPTIVRSDSTCHHSMVRCATAVQIERGLSVSGDVSLCRGSSFQLRTEKNSHWQRCFFVSLSIATCYAGVYEINVSLSVTASDIASAFSNQQNQCCSCCCCCGLRWCCWCWVPCSHRLQLDRSMRINAVQSPTRSARPVAQLSSALRPRFDQTRSSPAARRRRPRRSGLIPAVARR